MIAFVKLPPYNPGKKEWNPEKDEGTWIAIQSIVSVIPVPNEPETCIVMQPFSNNVEPNGEQGLWIGCPPSEVIHKIEEVLGAYEGNRSSNIVPVPKGINLR